jgi:hypothetical protein
MAIRIAWRICGLLILGHAALFVNPGCETTTTASQERWGPPNSNLPKMQGVNMPAGTSGNAPMPDGWKSSKLY